MSCLGGKKKTDPSSKTKNSTTAGTTSNGTTQAQTPVMAPAAMKPFYEGVEGVEPLKTDLLKVRVPIQNSNPCSRFVVLTGKDLVVYDEQLVQPGKSYVFERRSWDVASAVIELGQNRDIKLTDSKDKTHAVALLCRDEAHKSEWIGALSKLSNSKLEDKNAAAQAKENQEYEIEGDEEKNANVQIKVNHQRKSTMQEVEKVATMRKERQAIVNQLR